jgi:DNA primase
MKDMSQGNFEEELSELLAEKKNFDEFPQQKLDELYAGLDERSIKYFQSRGINKETVDYFKLGYSKNQDMVIVPVHSPDGIPVGLVGRSVEGKSFKNSTNLPRQRTMFNIHRARKMGGTIIIVESSFDAIRLHQVGYPNAVATLGGSLSNENIDNLNKYSNKIIIATDTDEAGRKLGNQLASRLSRKEIYWASYDSDNIYPHGAKDIGDMTEEEIKQCIKNAVPHYEYALRGVI